MKRTRRPKTPSAHPLSVATNLFNYTQAQWADIEAAVTTTRNAPLSDAERVDLLVAANAFFHNSAERESGTYVPPKVKTESWRKLEQRCGQLREALETACRYLLGDSWREEPITFLGVPGPTFGDVEDLAARVQVRAKEITGNPSALKPTIVQSFTGRLDPSVVFQQRILSIWTNHLKGRLTVTHDPISGEIKGALVKYFLAVAGPVMGEKLPSLQSLPDIVERQKLFQKEMTRRLRKLARKMRQKR